MKTLIMSKKLRIVVMVVFMIVTIVQGMGLMGSAYAAGSLVASVNPNSGSVVLNQNTNLTYTSGGDLDINPTAVPKRKKAVVLMDTSINPSVTPVPSSPFDYAIFSQDLVKTSGDKITISGNIRTNKDAEITAGGFEIASYKDEKGNTLAGKLQYVEKLEGSAIGSSKFVSEKVEPGVEIEQGLASEYLKNPDKYNVMEFNLANGTKTYTNDGKTVTLTNDEVGTQDNILKKIDSKKYGNLRLEVENGSWAIKNNTSGDCVFNLGEDDPNGKTNVWYFRPGLMISTSATIIGKGVIITDGNAIFQGAGVDGEILIYSIGGDITISTDAKMKKAVIYAPNGNVSLQGQNFAMDGSVIGKNVTTNMSNSSITYGKVSVVPEDPDEPTIDENIKAAARDFVSKMKNEYLDVNFIPYDGDANSGGGAASYTELTEYSIKGQNNQKALLNLIDGTVTDENDSRRTYANLGDGLRRAYYILEDDDIYSRYVIVLSSGVVKGWTERDNTSETTELKPYKTQSGVAVKFDDPSNLNYAKNSVEYAKFFSNKLKSDGINTYFVQLANVGKDNTLETLVNDVNKNNSSTGIMKYDTGTNTVPVALTESVNQEEFKNVEKVYLKSVEIKENYGTTSGMNVVSFQSPSGTTSSTTWVKNGDEAGFSGKYMEAVKDCANGNGIKIQTNGTFSIKPESVDAVIKFTTPGPVAVAKDSGEPSTRYIDYKYVFMDDNKFIDDLGNDLGTDISKIDEKYIKSKKVALDALNFTVDDKIAVTVDVWAGQSKIQPNTDFVKGYKSGFTFEWKINGAPIPTNGPIIITDDGAGNQIFKSRFDTDNPGSYVVDLVVKNPSGQIMGNATVTVNVNKLVIVPKDSVTYKSTTEAILELDNTIDLVAKKINGKDGSVIPIDENKYTWGPTANILSAVNHNATVKNMQSDTKETITTVYKSGTEVSNTAKFDITSLEKIVKQTWINSTATTMSVPGLPTGYTCEWGTSTLGVLSTTGSFVAGSINGVAEGSVIIKNSSKEVVASLPYYIVVRELAWVTDPSEKLYASSAADSTKAELQILPSISGIAGVNIDQPALFVWDYDSTCISLSNNPLPDNSLPDNSLTVEDQKYCSSKNVTVTGIKLTTSSTTITAKAKDNNGATEESNLVTCHFDVVKIPNSVTVNVEPMIVGDVQTVTIQIDNADVAVPTSGTISDGATYEIYKVETDGKAASVGSNTFDVIGNKRGSDTVTLKYRIYDPVTKTWKDSSTTDTVDVKTDIN